MTTLEIVTQQVYGEGAETNFIGECHILKAKRKGIVPIYWVLVA